MTSEQILDRMAQMIRVGFVNARQPEKMRVKVTLKDTVTSELVTDWLPVLCSRASQDMQYDLPDIGDQVLCLFLPYGLEQGFVIGSMYGKQTPPVQSGEKWHRRFSDGTYLEYDRQEHKLVANVQGNAELIASGTAMMKSEGPMTLEAPVIYARGKFVNTDKDGSPGKSVFSGGMEILNGGVAVPDADVVASGVSLVDHVHTGVQPGPGTSSFPAGGGNSQGTGTQKSISENSSAKTENHLQLLSYEVAEKGSDTDRLIMCLPEIANFMAERESNQADRQGWMYLHDMFKKWLSSISENNALSNKSIFWVPFDWLISFNRVAEKYALIKDRNFLFSSNAKNLLAERLKDDGLLTNKIEFFDYISILETEWLKKYYQSILIDRQTLPYPYDGLMAAMGSFRFRALAKGYTEPNQNGHLIVVEEVAVVATDSFNFNGDESYGFWQCDPPKSLPVQFDGGMELTNKDFNDFKKNYGHGGDFMVLSKPVIVFSGEEKYDTLL